MRFQTWHVEMAIAAIVLFGIAWMHAHVWTEWVGSLAVLVNFGYVSIADRLAERQAAQVKPDVECYWKLIYYFVAKESLWAVFFLATKSYSALAGVALFLIYPVWRKWYRIHYPLNRTTSSSSP
jgi:hypothetical protein